MGKHMFTTKLTTSQAKPIQPKIFDYINNRNVGISFWDHQTLQEITVNSGPNTKGNEFQTHYWSLNLRKHFDDGSIFDLSFPIVFFNYKQEVSPAAIDFEMKDVEEISNALVPLVNAEIATLQPLLTKFDQLDFKPTVATLNSIHRHPGGRSQSFSSTDLKTDHTYNTGIVFPLAKGDDTANFASIMAIVDDITYLAHSEYRIANGSVADQGLDYDKGRCVSYVRADPSISSEAEKLFGIPDKDQRYIVTKGLDANNPFILKLTAIWDEIDYMPNTQFVKPENVTKQVFKTTVNHQSSLPHLIKDTAKPMVTKTQTFLYKQDIAWYNSVVAEINKSGVITLLSVHAISQLKMNERIDYMQKLEQYYYNAPEIAKYDRIDLEDIHELHDCIIEEFLGIDQQDNNDDELDEFIEMQEIYARGG